MWLRRRVEICLGGLLNRQPVVLHDEDDRVRLRFSAVERGPCGLEARDLLWRQSQRLRRLVVHRWM
jgi:hypothetical protein